MGILDPVCTCKALGPTALGLVCTLILILFWKLESIKVLGLPFWEDSPSALSLLEQLLAGENKVKLRRKHLRFLSLVRKKVWKLSAIAVTNPPVS